MFENFDVHIKQRWWCLHVTESFQRFHELLVIKHYQLLNGLTVVASPNDANKLSQISSRTTVVAALIVNLKRKICNWLYLESKIKLHYESNAFQSFVVIVLQQNVSHMKVTMIENVDTAARIIRNETIACDLGDIINEVIKLRQIALITVP